jgi:hypothetical protein
MRRRLNSDSASGTLTKETVTLSLKSVIGRSYILAYRENVAPLAHALEVEQLHPTVLSAKYSEEEKTFARAIRTFMAHYSAWKCAREHEDYSLICEADFVPCIGLGAMQTFWPLNDPRAWGYLYQGSPRLLTLVGARPFLRAHCAPLVAYVVNAGVARALCDFFDDEMSRRDPTKYYPFDAHLQWEAMGRDCRAYMPMKHYGEHGGLPNPEHAAYGIPRAGQHRADNLASSLHFTPQYSFNSRLRYMAVRTHGRSLGLLRLVTSRWIAKTDAYHNNFATKARMYGVGIGRLLW